MASFDQSRNIGTGLRRLALLVCGIFALTLRAQAEVVPDLYAINVPVSEQSQNELQRAAAAGLRELAVRISGRSDAANDAALSALFGNAMRYLDQYRFERNTGGDAAWQAQLRFAPAQIDGELRKAGLPLWGANRPALQTVLLVEDKGARSIVDESSALATTLREQWRRRGLVSHLPRNANAINIDDVTKFDSAKIAANLPEHGDGLVLGRIVVAANGACESHWVFTLGSQTFVADAAGAAASACVAAAIDRIVDNFSAQYAIAANSSAEGLVLRVTGVASFDDYTALLNYVRRQALIKSSQIISAHADEIVLQLKIAGSSDQLTRQLALENRLTPAENTANTVLPAALSYRWSSVRN